MLLRTLSVAVACLSFPLWADPVSVISKVNASTTLTPSKSLNFASTQVKRYENILGETVVFGDPKIEDSPIQLTRSFKDEMKQNVDKETLERVIE